MSEEKLGWRIRNTKILKGYWHEHVTPIKSSVFGFFAGCSEFGCPGSRAASEMYESAKGQITVTSQQRALPLYHGTSERPPGRFPSERSITPMVLWWLVRRLPRSCGRSSHSKPGASLSCQVPFCRWSC